MFRNQKLSALIQREKEQRGILKQDLIKDNESRLENLRKITELSQELANKLAEFVFSDQKRTYNISSILTSTGHLNKEKDIRFKLEKGALKNLTNILGNSIFIRDIGFLHYHVGPVSDEYIYAYLVSKHISEQDGKVVFSNIDLNKLDENPNYAYAVANTLLTDDNIEFSKADGYIGEPSSQGGLKIGTETYDTANYTYQISSTHALVAQSDRIEAIRTYFRERLNIDGDIPEAIKKAYMKKLEKEQKEKDAPDR